MGWQDDAIVAPAAGNTAAPWEKDKVVYPAAGPRTGSGISDAISAGWQNSATGMIARNKLPDVQLDPQHSTWYERLAQGGTQMAADLPEMIVGAIGGGAAGSTILPGAGTVVGAGAGAFALPTAIRESYVQALSKGEITSSADFLDRASIVLKHTGKDALVGGLTAGVGKGVQLGATTLGAGSKVAAGAALTAEGGTMVVAPAALEGRLPEPRDFMDAALLLVGLKGAMTGAAKLRSIYQATGKTPHEVLADAAKDPTIKEDLNKGVEVQDLDMTEFLKAGGAAPATAPGRISVSAAWEAKDFDRNANPSSTDLPALTADVAKNGVQKPITITVDTTNGVGYVTDGNNRLAAARAAGAPDVPYKVETTDVPFTPEQMAKAKPVGELGIKPEELAPKAKSEEAKDADDWLKAFNEGSDLPRAYRDLARETNAKDAVPEPSPEAAKFIEKPFADVPQLPGEPILPTHVNYNYLNTTADVMGAMSRISGLYEAKVKESTRGTVPWEQTYAEARQMFEQTTGEKAPALPLENADYAKLSADLYARKQILTSGAEQLIDLRNKYAEARTNGTATDQMRVELLAQIERVAQAQAATRGAQAEVGRALNILKSTNRDKAYYDELTRLIDGRFGVEGKLGDANFEKMVDMMGGLGSPAEALKFAEKAAKATTWDKVMEAWKAGLVSGPVTQVANVLGNSTFMAMRPLVDTVAVGFSMARSGADRVTAVEPLARVIGNVHGTLDGAKAFAEVLRTGQLSDKAEVRRNAIGGVTGEVIRAPFRLLSAADAFFRVLNERGEAYTLAAREAAKEGYNPATREFRERVIEISRNPTDAMQDAIEAAGIRFTFNSPLGEAGRSVQKAISATHMEWAVPFVQTPANVAKELLRLTPAAPFIKEWGEAVKQGGAARDKALAEMAMGTALGATIFSFAVSGNISGQGDSDPKKRAAQLASGWQPYSVKVGDTWYSYQRLQPVGTLFGMAADAAAVWEHMTPEESDKLPKIIATAFANAITNQTFLQGITQVVNVLADPGRYGAKFAQSMTGSLIPAIVAQSAQMMDPYQREVYSVLDAVKGRIPRLRETLQPKRDIYGEPIVAMDRMGEITPITRAKESTDKVRLEAARLGVGAAKAPDHIELPAGRDSKLGKVALTPEQRDIFADKAGHMAHDILTQLVNQPAWDSMPDHVQRLGMNKVFEASRKIGQAAAVPPEQILKEAQRIATELDKRLQPKSLSE